MVVVLPEPFTPDDQDHEGLAGVIDDERLGAGSEDLDDRRLESGNEGGAVGELAPGDALPELTENAPGGLDADIGRDEACLELLEDRSVDLPAGEKIGQVAGEPRVTALQPLAQPREEPRPVTGRGGFILGRASEHAPL